ncbi:GNAT family N-acetyltransferase [Cohnella nanjingensis]|uniref:GNAT family N-acetyltransferase n=1 Tax=Cohnella nanjingensis TaxID=1387779 RepID=A0A7X0RMK9_9BACL|nr:GNAT family N-acetyltransferase [Cohnella nanjingensis]MBB6669091.1 GNAT family N-acetyltransferase [Cohnella nanjingensis]
MKIAHEIPQADEWIALKNAAGQRSPDRTAAEAALDRSLCSVVVRDVDASPIGMGRIVGDGGCYFQIVDLAVHPSRQGQGVEEWLMQALLSYLDRHAPEGAAVTTMADVASIPLYQKHGFKLVYPDLYGMSRQKTQKEVGP